MNCWKRVGPPLSHASGHNILNCPSCDIVPCTPGCPCCA
jgi:hypothetical protein